MSDLPLWTTLLAIFLPVACIYCYLLNLRLRGPHSLLQPDAPPPQSEWDALGDYSGVSMSKHYSQTPTQRGYVVVGGSGLLGSWIVGLLLRRGETHIRVVDITPPSNDFVSASEGKVEYFRTDIAGADAVNAVLGTAFSDGTRPSVVLHTASTIRYWERLPYLAHFSDRINIQGTRNLLDAAARLGIEAFVYTSTAALSNPKGYFMRLGWGPVKSKEDFTAREDIVGTQDHHYCRTKRVADEMTRRYDGRAEGRLRTAVIRPGMTICGPYDVTFGMYLKLAYSRDPPPTIPDFHGSICQHAVNAQDLAAGHILMADALLDPAKVDEVAGEAFMLTGDQKLYSFFAMTRMLQYFSRRPIPFVNLSPVILYFLGHVIEAFCYIRYHLLLISASVTFLIFRTKRKTINPVPAWLGPAGGLQPSMFETGLTNVYVDDSKIRKTLGYRNAWTTLQTIRWLVDEFERDWDAKKVRPGTLPNGEAKHANGSVPVQNGAVVRPLETDEVNAGAVAVAAEAKESVRSKLA